MNITKMLFSVESVKRPALALWILIRIVERVMCSFTVLPHFDFSQCLKEPLRHSWSGKYTYYTFREIDGEKAI